MLLEQQLSIIPVPMMSIYEIGGVRHL